jgi:SAM-dependent methyltransferase
MNQTPGQVMAWMREDPEMQVHVRASYYDNLPDAFRRFVRSAEFAAVLAIAQAHGIQPGARVLDLGGGNGVAAMAWADVGYTVMLAEPDDDPIVGYGAIQALTANGETTVNVVSALGETIPVSDQHFDIVYVRQVLHHIPDLDTLCQEVYRVLRPGGVFLATREHIIDQPEDLQAFYEKHLLHRYTLGEHAYLLSDYQRAINRAGFDLEVTLAPWSSPINYYPRTPDNIRERAARALRHLGGMPIARQLVRLPGVLNALTAYWNYQDRTPGRMVSFIAVRPK